MSDFSSFFDSSARNKGAELVRKNLVVLSSATDTNVSALIRGSSACRVNLAAEEVTAESFSTNCTCPPARKGELCKHIWAVLLKLEEKGADFLAGKSAVQSPGVQSSPAHEMRKAKANEFKTQQRERLKERNKEMRLRKKNAERGPQFTYPDPVQESIEYFKANGFALEQLDMPSILNARKILARVFHPDKGGTHQEILDLNAHFDCLEEYLNS